MTKNGKSHADIERRRNFRNPTFAHQTPVQCRRKWILCKLTLLPQSGRPRPVFPVRERVGRGVAPASSTFRTRRLVVPSPLTPTLSRKGRGSQKSLRPRALLLFQRHWPKLWARTSRPLQALKPALQRHRRSPPERLHPLELLADVVGQTVLANMVGNPGAEDFHPVQLGLAHAGGAIVQVSHLLEVNAHERHGHSVGGQPVEAGDGDPVLYRRASHGSVALHRLVAVDALSCWWEGWTIMVPVGRRRHGAVWWIVPDFPESGCSVLDSS